MGRRSAPRAIRRAAHHDRYLDSFLAVELEQRKQNGVDARRHRLRLRTFVRIHVAVSLSDEFTVLRISSYVACDLMRIALTFALRARSSSGPLESAVSTTTGSVCNRKYDRVTSRNEGPSISGMSRSRMTKSVFSPRTASKASFPSGTT